MQNSTVTVIVNFIRGIHSDQDLERTGRAVRRNDPDLGDRGQINTGEYQFTGVIAAIVFMVTLEGA